MSGDESVEEIKTWLERSETLFQSKQYDLALFAAEKVFLYDSTHAKASQMIDKIKRQALKEGKADILFLNQMYEEEISDRLTRYRDQAQAFFQEGQLGRAKYTVEKILLLEPDDPKALRLYQEILSNDEARRHEA